MRLMIRYIFIFCILTVAVPANANGQGAVLVVSKQSEIEHISPKDLRRIFLGLRPLHSPGSTRPLINTSNEKTYRHFLKKVMFLTETGYKRKIIKRVFRKGADEIPSVDNINDAVEHLLEHPDAVTFMPKELAEAQDSLRVVQVLW